jgi:hypothetical protein
VPRVVLEERVRHRLVLEPRDVLRHATRPHPVVVEIDHRQHVSFRHLGEQEVETVEQPLVVDPKLGLQRRPDSVVLAETLRRPEHAQVVDAKGLKKIELTAEAVPVPTFGECPEVAAVPEVGAEEVVGHAVPHEMVSLHLDELLNIWLIGRAAADQKDRRQETGRNALHAPYSPDLSVLRPATGVSAHPRKGP